MGHDQSRLARITRFGVVTLLVVLLLATVTTLGGVAWILAEFDDRLAVQTDPSGTPGAGILTYRETAPANPPLVKTLHKNLDLQALANPEQSRPWTRWWWPGGDVTFKGACTQLSDLKAQGFGGVEIQAFDAGLRHIEDPHTQDRLNSFGDADWFQTLASLFECAERQGVVVYLNHLSGWPAGGPQVNLEDGLWTLRHGETIVSGGERNIELPLPKPSTNEYLMGSAEYFLGMELVSFAVDQRELVAVLAAEVTGGERTVNPLDSTDTLGLNPASVHVLNDHVRGEHLDWQAPPGQWAIIAFYLMPSGEPPTLIAAQHPGYIIDHLDEDKLNAHYDYAYGSRTGLDAYYGRSFAGFFNDSIEFKLDRLAAKDILDAFATRRGYDLVPHLPKVLVDTKDNFFIRDVGRTRAAPSYRFDELDPRVRYDYQLTLSDLMIERFAENSTRWAEQRGLLSRAQTYGFEMDTLRALGANHIPETEHLWGNSSEYVMKLAGAAGYLYQRPLISAEAFVWAKRAYAVTGRHVKAGADLLFLSGVNQIVYHGVPYSVTDGPDAYQSTFDWLGWYPFQGPENPSGFSGNYGPTTPIWEVLPELNTYIARSQHILQAGQPSVDVLVYYPFLGFPKSIEDSDVAGDALLFAGLFPDEPSAKRSGSGPTLPFVKFLPSVKDHRLVWLERLIPTLRALDAKGITWTWVNDHALQTDRIDPDAIAGLLFADIEAMPGETLSALSEQQDRGLKTFFLGKLPVRQRGYLNAASGDQYVREEAKRMASGRSVANAQDLVNRISPAVEIVGAPEVRRVSRDHADGSRTHLLINRSLRDVGATLSLTEESNAYWFDAASGALWQAEQTTENKLELSLSSLESRFLIETNQTLAVTHPPLSVTALNAESIVPLDGKWTLIVGGDIRDLGSTLPVLKEVPYTDGSATPLSYELEFELDDSIADADAIIDLGQIAGHASLEVNGVQFPSRAFDPFLYDMSGAVKSGTNTLRVVVTPPLRNSILTAGLMDQEMQQFSGKLGPVGLFGPVTLLLGARNDHDDGL